MYLIQPGRFEVFEIGEDGFPSIIPQRVGERDAGVSQERVMHSTVGSYSGIRTVEHENHDKSITSLRTRSGWPVFETEGETSVYTPPVYCFQGFPASQHVVYGVKVSGANYVAADPGDPEGIIGIESDYFKRHLSVGLVLFCFEEKQDGVEISIDASVFGQQKSGSFFQLHIILFLREVEE